MNFLWNLLTLWDVVNCMLVLAADEPLEPIQLKGIREPEACLFAHNYIREVWHGTGKLEWDADLAYEAEKWAIHLALQNQNMHHSSMVDESGKPFGENIYSFDESTSKRCIDAVYFWYMERKRANYNFENIVYNQNAGHMMQLLWKTTNKVGVGVVTTRDKTWIVARYKPPGNSQTTNIKNFIGKPLKGGFPKKNELGSPNNPSPLIYVIKARVSSICRDDFDDCSSYLTQCNSPTIQKKCQKSCGVPQSQCEKKGEWTQWMKVSECSKDCQYTEERYCINTSQRNGGINCVGNNRRFQNCANCKCNDVDAYCADRQIEGYCEMAPDWAKRQCKKTCKFCGFSDAEEEFQREYEALAFYKDEHEEKFPNHINEYNSL